MNTIIDLKKKKAKNKKKKKKKKAIEKQILFQLTCSISREEDLVSRLGEDGGFEGLDASVRLPVGLDEGPVRNQKKLIKISLTRNSESVMAIIMRMTLISSLHDCYFPLRL